MYMAYLQTTEYKLDTLRLILLSGDWIPVKLVEKIHQKMPNVQCISLGGATEGGIWSIYYPTDRVKSKRSAVLCGFGDDIHYDAVCPWYYDGGLAAFLHLSQ